MGLRIGTGRRPMQVDINKFAQARKKGPQAPSSFLYLSASHPPPLPPPIYHSYPATSDNSPASPESPPSNSRQSHSIHYAKTAALNDYQGSEPPSW